VPPRTKLVPVRQLGLDVLQTIYAPPMCYGDLR